ncbi:MAG: PAS domain S-box protein [Planctomycetaceae bacterium]
MTQTPLPISIPDYLTVTDAAKLLGVSPWTLRNWDNAGKLKAERHPVNGYRMYRSQDLRAILESGELVGSRKRAFSPTIDWSDIAPSEHFVQFYESVDYLVESVSGFFAPALVKGDGALMIARPDHRAKIEKRLTARGIDIKAAIDRGQFIILDAEETLSQFLHGDALDRDRFTEVVGGYLGRLAQSWPAVRAFGEMVAILWEQKKRDLACQLEELWNGIGNQHAFALFCGYPMSAFGEEADGDAFSTVCAHHSRVIPSESYAGLSSAEDRMREISILQQKARALQAEVAHRKRIEDELSDFVENALEGLHKVGADGRIIWANRAELDLLGYHEHEYIGHHVAEFHADREVIDDILCRLADGRSIFNAPARLVCKDGSIKHVLIHSNGCYEGDKLLYSRCFTRDVTDSRRAEEDRALLAAIVESSHDAIISKDIHGVITSWNSGAQRLFGYTVEEAIGQPVTMLIPADRLDEEPGILDRIRRGERIDHYETIRRRKDGTLIDVSLTVSPVVDAQGRIIGASKIARDISERKKAEEQLRDSEERYRRLSDLTPVGVYTCDAPMGRITYFNRQAGKLWGREPDIGDTDERFCGSLKLRQPDGAVLPHEETPMAVALREGRKFRNQDVIVERPDGTQINVLVNIDPIRDVNGLVIGAINAFHDTTVLKRAQGLVEEQKQILELIAKGEPLERCLEELCQSIRRIDSRIRAGVVLTDESRSSFATMIAPQLPRLVEAMRGAAIGDGTKGTCAQAIVSGTPIVCGDVASDSRWHGDWTSFCLSNGIRAVFSTPIVEGSAQPQGSVFLCFDSAKEPDEWDLRIADMAAGLAGIVLHRDRAEKAVRESEEQFRTLSEAIPVLVWACRPDGSSFYLSRQWTEYTGQTAEESCGSGWIESVHPDDRARVFAHWQHCIRTGEIYDGEIRYRRHDGEYRWHYYKALPIRDDSGAITAWYGTSVDITERKQAEAAMRNSEIRFRSMANVTPAIIWTAASDGAITWSSDRWYEYTGISREANVREWPQVLHPDDVARCVVEWNQALAAGTDYEIEVRNRRYDGQYRWFLTRATPIRDPDGRIVEWYGSTTDIHDRKQAEESLREADRRKDEFLALLAHELRNPLAPIRSGLELIKYVKDDPVKLEETRETMERQTRQLISLVDDLLDVSRITRGKLELRKRAVKLAEVVQCAVDSSQPHIEEARHHLTVELPPQSLVLDADPNRLAQVFANLLNNAVKFTPDGGEIRLSATREGDELVVTVTDNGIGIPAEMRERIFEMFTQVDRQQEKVHTGLGIGLTLVKSLVGLHNGGIEVRSDGLGKGSEFTVRLPIIIDAPAEDVLSVQIASSEKKAATTLRRVLVVDDNKAAADMLSMVVKLLGNDVRTASDGRKAFEVAAEYRPDVVLMDIGMPIMNGFESAQAIRGQPWGKEIVLIALTGWGQDEDKRRSREAGFDQHLVKPPEPSQLRQILSEIEPRSAET